MNLLIKKLSDKAIIPTRVNPTDAGLDLYSCEDYVLQPLERKLFKTNIAIQLPPGYYGRIADRSGNALKRGLHVMGGVLDESYRGDVGVILLNVNYEKCKINDRFISTFNSVNWTHWYPNVETNYNVSSYQEEDFYKMQSREVEIKAGERIAQLIIENYHVPNIIEVDELDQTIRGENGFNSSGK
jgi:dUTP pyrophosphatase